MQAPEQQLWQRLLKTMQHRKWIIALSGLLLLGSLIGWRKIVKNIEMTARIAWGEARNQGRAGMQAVINVIDNRSRMDLFNDGKPDWWGEGHAEVATKPYQFSAYNENDPNRPKLDAVNDNDRNFAEAIELASMAVRGDLPDLTNGATHYHSTKITPPNWTRGAIPTAVIGDHIFYKGVA